MRYDDSLGLQVKEDGKDDKKMQTLAKKEKWLSDDNETMTSKYLNITTILKFSTSVLSFKIKFKLNPLSHKQELINFINSNLTK